jgi:hypothetical protein
MPLSEFWKHENRVVSSIKLVIVIGVGLVVGTWGLAIIGWIVGYLMDPNVMIFVSSILGSGMIAQMVQGGIMKAANGGLFDKLKRKPEPPPAKPAAKPKAPTKPAAKPKAPAKSPAQTTQRFPFTIDDLHCNDARKTPVPENLRGNAMQLLDNLEVIWRESGYRQMTITNAYRTKAHNRRVGGAKASYHMRAMAGDIRIAGMRPTEVRSLLERLMDEGKITAGGYYCMSTATHYDTRGTKFRVR